MQHFTRDLERLNSGGGQRRWLFIPNDQLTDALGPLSREHPTELGIVLVESRWELARRPYHKQRLALRIANQRRFALEQAARGVAMRYLTTDEPCSRALAALCAELGPLRAMIPAKRDLRDDLDTLVRRGDLELLEHEGWLTTRDDFRAGAGADPPWRMDAFYRHARRRSGVLMEKGRPVGGEFSIDAANRRPWKAVPPALAPPLFRVDALKREVGERIESAYGHHPGSLDLASLPSSAADAKRLWEWTLARRPPSGLLHSRITALLELHRLLPGQVIADAIASDLPLASKEGCVRQVLGWREFVRHVHQSTDGFRGLAALSVQPPGPSCLDRVVGAVWEAGWNHQIPRLILLANTAALIDASPRELGDWYRAAFSDTFSWAVELSTREDLVTERTRGPGSAANECTDAHCENCTYGPESTCPVRALYRAVRERHRPALAGGTRSHLPRAAHLIPDDRETGS